MKGTYWQRGETLDYANAGAEVIEANTVVVIGQRIGVAGTTIKPGEIGSLNVTGVFQMAKKASEEIAMGTPVYYAAADQTITATADGNTPAGYAAASAVADDTDVLVVING